MMRRACPEDCRYYNRLTRFCGYCMMDILDDMEGHKHGQNKQSKEVDIEQAGGVWVRYGAESAAAVNG